MRCVNTQFTSSPQAPVKGRQLKATSKIDLNALNLLLAAFTVTSHTGNLNICGGFNCIAFYSVLDVGEQISRSNPSKFNGKISLPPPFPSTINRGTGRYVDLEAIFCRNKIMVSLERFIMVILQFYTCIFIFILKLWRDRGDCRYCNNLWYNWSNYWCWYS